MTSKLKTDVLETVSGSGTIALTNQLSGMTDASMPTGSVLQVVHATGNTEVASTAISTWVGTSGSIFITPTSASSKILINHTAGGMIMGNGGNIGIRIKQVISGGSNVYLSTSYRHGYISTTTWVPHNWPMLYLDSPNTTNAIEYSIEMYQTSASQANMRYCDTSYWNFIAQEIKG